MDEALACTEKIPKDAWHGIYERVPLQDLQLPLTAEHVAMLAKQECVFVMYYPNEQPPGWYPASFLTARRGLPGRS